MFKKKKEEQPAALHVEELEEVEVVEDDADAKAPARREEKTGKNQDEKSDKEQEEKQDKKSDSKEKPKKKSIKGKLIAILILILILVAGGFLVVRHFQTIEVDLAAMASQPKYTGQNGRATATVDISKQARKELLKDIRKDERQTQMKQFLKTVEYKVKPSWFLSNGDEIKIIAKYDKSMARQYHIKVTEKEKTITVKGLKEKNK